MKTSSTLARIALVSAAAFAAIAASPAAQAQGMRIVDGQAFWRGDPGPVAPDAFWAGGQFRHDPQHYLSYYGSEPQDFTEVVFADHAGKARCVWRKRVENSDWEYRHPYLRVCRH